MVDKRMKKDEIIKEYRELEIDYAKLVDCYDYALDMVTWFIKEFRFLATPEQVNYIHHRALTMISLIIKRISNDKIDRQGSSDSICIDTTREEV